MILQTFSKTIYFTATDVKAYNKTEEPTLTHHLNMRFPAIKNFHTIQNKNVVIATYQIAISAYINREF